MLNICKLESVLRKITNPSIEISCGQINGFQGELAPEEYCLSQKASAGRRQEFIAGRNCLRESVNKIHTDSFLILRGIDGRPLLPNGIVGSISHKYPFIVSVAAQSYQFPAVGIDIERVDDWSPKTASIFTTPIDFFDYELLDLPFNQYCSILFSAKESLFKVLMVAREYEGLGMKSISPTIVKVSQEIYGFHMSYEATRCTGQVQIIDQWVVAVCWSV